MFQSEVRGREEDEQTEGEEQRPSSTEELSVAWCLLSYFLLHLLLLVYHLLLSLRVLSSETVRTSEMSDHNISLF